MPLREYPGDAPGTIGLALGEGMPSDEREDAPLETSGGLTPEQRLQMAWQVFQTMEYQVQLADQKVQAIFGVSGLLVAALSFEGQTPWSELRATGLTPIELVGLLIQVALLSCVLLATGAAIAALRPRVRSKMFVPPLVSGPLLFFFGDIARRSPMEYGQAFLGTNIPEATQHIVQQAHTVSVILTVKYRQMSLATTALAAALFLWALLHVLRFFA